jgi:uncharacterized membrane protein YkvA (DUF1232 family)
VSFGTCGFDPHLRHGALSAPLAVLLSPMTALQWLLVALGILVALYAAFVAYLFAAGRNETARAVARFVPDCVVLFRRLLADPRVPRRHKIVLGALVAYLAMPIDLVPDFIPVAGYLDDAVLVALVLRHVLRGSAAELIDEHWPGPDESRSLIMRLASSP